MCPAVRSLTVRSPLRTGYLQIWSMKKDENAAAKKKPKTSAAQIRVQKGERQPGGLVTWPRHRELIGLGGVWLQT